MIILCKRKRYYNFTHKFNHIEKDITKYVYINEWEIQFNTNSIQNFTPKIKNLFYVHSIY